MQKEEVLGNAIGKLILCTWNAFCIWKLSHSWWVVAIGVQVMAAISNIEPSRRSNK